MVVECYLLNEEDSLQFIVRLLTHWSCSTYL